MKTRLTLIATLLLLGSCGLNDPKSALGFRLPDGDADAGRRAFVTLGCHFCHQVERIDAPSELTGPASVALGGETTRVRTYGELVTSIINPSHRIAPAFEPAAVTDGAGSSLMELPAYNDRMTVQQLTDLVAFLQQTYRVVPPPYNPYTIIYP